MKKEKEFQDEKEYSVTITASYGVNATSQEDANQYVLHQFWNGNTNYTENVEIKE